MKAHVNDLRSVCRSRSPPMKRIISTPCLVKRPTQGRQAGLFSFQTKSKEEISMTNRHVQPTRTAQVGRITPSGGKKSDKALPFPTAARERGVRT